MDLFAKDHPLEAAALREKIAKSRLRSFVFEELPHAVRHRIYRELLLKPNHDDSQSEAEYFNEHDEIRDRIMNLKVEFLEDNHEMHPEIMRTKKKIHEEAAAVLYGENWFTWDLFGRLLQPIWHGLDHETTLCPRRYSRLITKLHLMVSTRGGRLGHTGRVDAIFWTTTNLKQACQMLSLNDFNILMVSFYNDGAFGHGRKRYWGQRCLEPLKKCRAEKVGLNHVPRV